MYANGNYHSEHGAWCRPCVIEDGQPGPLDALVHVFGAENVIILDEEKELEYLDEDERPDLNREGDPAFNGAFER